MAGTVLAAFYIHYLIRSSGLEVGIINLILDEKTGEGNGNPLQYSCLGESQGRRSLVGCRLWGRTEADTTEATKQQQLSFYLRILGICILLSLEKCSVCEQRFYLGERIVHIK